MRTLSVSAARCHLSRRARFWRDDEVRDRGQKEGRQMADITRLGEISLPKLSENMDPADRRSINNYLMQLRDQMIYMMQNLDETNFSDSMRDKLTARGLKVE